MKKCTQNSENSLTNKLISIVLSNVNTGICFYRAKPTIGMRLSLEETIIENLPFAHLVATESETGRHVLHKLQALYNKVVQQLPVEVIELHTDKQGE